MLNRQAAIDEMTKERTRIVKGEPKAVAPGEIPTFEQFRECFMKFVDSTTDNEGTRQFYAGCFDRLSEFKPLGRAKLNAIDENVIEQFKLFALRIAEPSHHGPRSGHRPFLRGTRTGSRLCFHRR
jgi:hypothetical protein